MPVPSMDRKTSSVRVKPCLKKQVTHVLYHSLTPHRYFKTLFGHSIGDNVFRHQEGGAADRGTWR